jgi:Spy/CpxP family protein refolding chaperone
MKLDLKKTGAIIAGAGLVTAAAIGGTAAFADDSTTTDSTETTTTESHRGGPHHIESAAEFLGLTEAELFAELEAGKTLAEVAEAQGKTVDALVDALVAEAETAITEMVNTPLPEREEGMDGHHGGRGHGHHGFGGYDFDDSTTSDDSATS